MRNSIQQNDARAVDEIEAMKEAVDPQGFFSVTGGSINQQLVAPKLRWLERHEPERRKRARAVLGSYNYITARLCGALSIERNWALEAGFMDLAQGTLDEGLLALGGLSPDDLPPLHASHEVVGAITHEASGKTGLAAGTPVVAGCADHIASAFVAGASHDGDLVVKYGGAGDIMLSCSTPVTDPRMFIDFHIVPGLFFTNGCMAASGSVLNWIADNLARAEAEEAKRRGTSVHAYLDSAASALPPGAGGVVLLPYFLGEKTPLHDPQARGTLTGLGLHHGLPHVWRAALESVAFGFRHHAEVFAEMGLDISRVLACDGGAASDLWVQITADVLERPIERLLDHPGSCLGAAFRRRYGASAPSTTGRPSNPTWGMTASSNPTSATPASTGRPTASTESSTTGWRPSTPGWERCRLPEVPADNPGSRRRGPECHVPFSSGRGDTAVPGIHAAVPNEPLHQWWGWMSPRPLGHIASDAANSRSTRGDPAPAHPTRTWRADAELSNQTMYLSARSLLAPALSLLVPCGGRWGSGIALPRSRFLRGRSGRCRGTYRI